MKWLYCLSILYVICLFIPAIKKNWTNEKFNKLYKVFSICQRHFQSHEMSKISCIFLFIKYYYTFEHGSKSELSRN